MITSQLIQLDDLKNFLSIVDDFVITSITDSKGVITDVSKAFCRVSGYTKEELLNQPHNIVRHEDTPAPIFEDMWKTIKSGKMWQGEIKNKKKDGGFYWVVSSVFPRFDDDKNIVGYISLRQDITDSKLLHEHEKLLKVQSKNAAMGEMISMITHQWAQPLSAISVTSSHVLTMIHLDQVDLKKLESDMHDIQNFITYLTDTTTAFKNFFNPRDKEKKILLSDILSYSIQLISPLLIEKQIALVYQYKQSTPQSFTNDDPFRCNTEDEQLFLNAARNDIVQILLNLIKNSVDAFSDSKTQDPVIHIHVHKKEGMIELVIEDNAGGIDPSIFPSIFSPYRTSKGDQGTGLGLYMCKKIIEEHTHGSISAENTPDGARFTIRLPEGQ